MSYINILKYSYILLQEFFIEEGSVPAFDLETIIINSCKRVRFGNNALNKLNNLRNIRLINIENLVLEESSLLWENYVNQPDFNSQWDLNIPALQIIIENTHIEKISSYTFKGRISEISLIGVTVDQISPFAFSSLIQNQAIHFEYTDLKNVQAQAFKKFTTNNLHLISTRADFLPSRAFSDIQINQNLIINNCTFDTMRPSSFFVSNPRNFEVRNSRFNQLDGEAFRITMRGPVLFKDNVFNTTNDGAFRGIILPPEQALNEHTITFDGNTFNVVTRDSLITTSFIPKFLNIFLNESCDCKSINRVLKDSDFYDEVQCLAAENMPITVRDFEKNNCSIITSHGTLIIVVGVVLIVFIIVLSALVFYFKKVRNSDKYGKNNDNKNGKLSLIVPDGRTYRETEVHVIVEKANLLTTDL